MSVLNTALALLAFCGASLTYLSAKACDGLPSLSNLSASNHHEAWGVLFRVLSNDALRELAEVPEPALALRASWELSVIRGTDGLTEKEAGRFMELVKERYDIEKPPTVWESIVFDSVSLPKTTSGSIGFEVRPKHRSSGSSSRLRYSNGFEINRVNEILEIVPDQNKAIFKLDDKVLIGADLAIARKEELLAVVSYDFDFPASGKLFLLSGEETCWRADVWGLAFGAIGNTKQYIDVVLTDECVLIFGVNAAFVFIEAFDLSGNCLSRFTSAELVLGLR